jgi:tetratricopeptide (TPR) repeat protein
LRLASPREQMEQAMGRGDYAAAAKFAAPILRTNPDDAYANFAVGMDHFGKQTWDRAVTHLTRCVKQSPDEPAFLNNLAIALLYKGRYDEALKHAQKALKIQPDSEVVQDTINQIKKARAELTPKKPDSKKKPAEKKPAGKKPQKKAGKTEEPPKPAESPAPADAPTQDDTEGLVPAAPSTSENM